MSCSSLNAQSCIYYTRLKKYLFINFIVRGKYYIELYIVYSQVLMTNKLQSLLYTFIIGLSDSLSPYWLKHILFVMNPMTKQIHPSSYKLIHTFKNAFIQVIVLLVGLPAILDYFNLDLTAKILKIMFLLLSYGYLFFYNI